MPRTFSDNLFRLIKSLTTEEKRYFRQHLHLNGHTPVYLQLFDAMDAQDEYDEKKMLRKVRSIRPTQVSNQKNYLYKAVLESLRKMREEEDAEQRIVNLIKEAEILFDKRLTGQCLEMLQKARKMALKYDKHRTLFSILAMEETLHNESARGEEFEKRMDAIFDEGNRTAENERRLQELRRLLNSVSRYFRLSGLLRDKTEIEKLNAMMQHPVLNPSKPYVHFHERFYFLNTHAMYHMLMRDWQKTYYYRRELFRLFEENPHMKTDMKKAYVSVLNNYILACEFTKNFRELERTFFSVREMFHDPANRRNLHLMLRIMGGYSSMLHSCIVFGEFENGLKLFREIEPVFVRLHDQVNRASAISFYYTFAYIHFGCGDMRRSLSWLNRIFNAGEMDVREDILIFSKLMNLVIHYELGHESSLEYFVRSTYRFLLKRRSHFRLQNIVIDFIGKKMPRISNRREELAAFLKLRDEVKELARDPQEARALEYFDFLSWLNSKISGKSFAEEVRRRAVEAK